jgi:LuxR family transcriptional regulator, maltose regulon positive regulatory protein
MDDRVARTHLLQRLRDAAQVPIVLLVAPAGYGKTTLLRQWDALDPRPFAWLPHGAELEPGASRVLVLDDAHLLDGPALATLVATLPPGSQLALAGRHEPALPVGRLRAHRQLVELRTADLAMTRTEATTLLRRAGAPLDRSAVEALMRSTEGWPAALYLAALSVREQDDAPEAAARFAGDDRLLADYLRDELLASLPADRVRLLVRCSVLDRLSGPLCDAVLGRTGCGRVLAELAREQLLLIPLDRGGAWYRCHRLLGELLRAELRRSEPEREPLLRRRASAWYAANGDVERAIDHAAAAGAVAEAGALLWANAGAYVAGGRNELVARWLARFSSEQLAASAPLALTAAASRLAAGDLDAVEHWTRAAAGALAGAPSADPSLRTGLIAMRAAAGRGGLVRMAQDAARAAALEPADGPWRPLCCLLEGVGRHVAGDVVRARALLEEGARRGAVGAPLVQALCLAQLALLTLDQDDWHGGALLSTRACAQVGAYGLGDYPATALVLAVAAAVRARRGRVEEAEDAVRRAGALLEPPAELVPWYATEARIALASAALRLSDVAGARRRLAEAARELRREPGARVLHGWVAALSARAEAAADSALGDGWALTTAELRVLQMLPTHFSYPDIARRLFVSPNTVKTHTRAVYRKLDARSRDEAVVRARQAGLLDVSEMAA